MSGPNRKLYLKGSPSRKRAAHGGVGLHGGSAEFRRRCTAGRKTSAASFASGTPERAAEKVGRNDPCPCGSEKKHKKCCGRPS